MADGKKGREEGRMGIQKFEYPENKNSFLDEIKSIFYNYLRSVIWWKNKEQQTQVLNTGSHILPTFFPIPLALDCRQSKYSL